MNVLVTGGAGFIGRWVVKRLLDDDHNIWVIDNLTNGRESNLTEYMSHSSFREFKIGDVKDRETLADVFKNKFDVCYHLAASINVQDSIDDPQTTFTNDVVGTFNILEECRKNGIKMVFMSTCMVYDTFSPISGNKGIGESHPTKPASPYAGSKIAGENLVLSYWNAYRLPVVVIRPFNTYGPFQKSSGEGGVIAIFIERMLSGELLNIYGDGSQTRDFLYVEDCADFVVTAGYSERTGGLIINAGTGQDISISDLALAISKNPNQIRHIEHIHPQSEIMKLLCNYEKALQVLGWTPKTPLSQGIAKTTEWIKRNMGEN